MKAYIYFAGPDTAAVSRCAQLVNQAAGSLLVSPDVSETPAYPDWSGVPIGKGSEAPPNNMGCNLVEGVRIAVLSGPQETLSIEERDELLAFYALGVELDHTWFYPPEEE